MTRKDILAKAKAKMKREEAEGMYLSECSRANICPKCGSDVKWIDKTPKASLFNWIPDPVGGEKCTNCDWNDIKELPEVGMW